MTVFIIGGKYPLCTMDGDDDHTVPMMTANADRLPCTSTVIQLECFNSYKPNTQFLR